MPAYAIDFRTIKASVTLEQTVAYLGLKGKKTLYQGLDHWRLRCPVCKTEDDRSLAITEGRGAFCQALGRGGDQIWLVSHIKGISNRDAAQELAQLVRPQEPATAPQAVKKATPTPAEGETPLVSKGGVNGDAGTYAKLAPLTYLLYEHPAVQAMGFSPDMAEDFGIGFANKGTMRGKVCIPIYHMSTLIGYVGMEPDADVRLPSNLHGAS